jgi:hypothetical protein
MLLRQFFLVH